MSCSADVLSLLEKLRQEQQFVSFYKKQLRGGVQELNKSCDNVFQSLWVTHTLTFALGRVLSHTVLPYEWSIALEQGVSFTDAANVLSQHTLSYSQFLLTLLTETRLLADVLTLTHTDGLDSQHLLSDLMTVVFGHCLFQNDHALYLQLLQELLRQHVNGCSSPQANSLLFFFICNHYTKRNYFSLCVFCFVFVYSRRSCSVDPSRCSTEPCASTAPTSPLCAPSSLTSWSTLLSRCSLSTTI